VVLAGRGPLLIGGYNFPPLELKVEVLRYLPEHVDEEQIVVEHPVLVLPAETENAVVLELAAAGGVEVVGLDYLMPGDAFVRL
jgi:hypothetical protein